MRDLFCEGKEFEATSWTGLEATFTLLSLKKLSFTKESQFQNEMCEKSHPTFIVYQPTTNTKTFSVDPSMSDK